MQRIIYLTVFQIDEGESLLSSVGGNPAPWYMFHQLFARAVLIATDDHQQCLDHGDFGHAVRAGSTTGTSDTPVGLLLDGSIDRPDGAITVADLTGVGALDAALASALLRELTPQTS